ncbi:hypothetical protein SASPL_151805 [Salvia splendens]|uniref:Zinc-finger domain-containing protein n=1 Tax=Salvia splendens TaxID=180675 RepID=A0A8X8YZE9_SALSN|nr:hypothetical protein SASPL_151805 [Salvia splendens]
MPFTDAAAHVEHPFASIAKLESRRDDTDRYVGGLHAQPRPPPAPPNGQLSYAPTFQPDSGLDPTVPSSHKSLFLEQLQSEQVVIVKEKLSELHLYSSDVSLILNGNYGERDSSNSFSSRVLNKYGEEAEVVDAFGEWSCSKSIRICNCLVCLTKKGNQPTGILIDMTKKIGLSFVSEVLLKEAQDLSCEKIVGVLVASPLKEVAHSFKKWRKENYFKVYLVLPDETNEKSNKTKIEFFFTFFSFALYAELHLPFFNITNNSKTFFSNIIAFEMSPETETDYGVTSYFNFMKTLILNASDVKVLREKGILYSRLASDEEVVEMFKSIDTYGYSKHGLLDEVKMRIEEHCSSKAKTWMADLVNTKFRSPWAVIALAAAAFLLALTVVQTYYTVNPSD